MNWDSHDYYQWWCKGPLLDWSTSPPNAKEYRDNLNWYSAGALQVFCTIKGDAVRGNEHAVQIIAWLIAQRLAA